mmetsp:Transcript_21393/g.33091  ORF Transcript_21393/g.33091 Transcript_21393/m.33091 type:complete len:85 (-) Transcript_21393:3674-3928(-)
MKTKIIKLLDICRTDKNQPVRAAAQETLKLLKELKEEQPLEERKIPSPDKGGPEDILPSASPGKKRHIKSLDCKDSEAHDEELK